jgi:hypothetical protein
MKRQVLYKLKFLFSIICTGAFYNASAQLPITEETFDPGRNNGMPVNRVHIFTQKNKYGLKKNDSILLAAVYDEILATTPTLFQLKQNKRYGAADKSGKIFIPVQFDSIKAASHNNGAVVVYDKNKAGAVSITGEEVLPVEYEKILYTNALSKYSFAIKEGNPFLLFGKQTVKLSFQSLSFFNNLVVFGLNGKYGLLKNGTALYDSIYVANQKSYHTTVANNAYSEYRMIANTLIILQNNKYGLMNNDGFIITMPEYDNIKFDHSRKVFHIKKDSLTGLYIEATKKLTPILFQSVYSDGMQYINVKKNGYYGIINYKTEEIIACKYDKIDNLGSGAGFRVKYNGKSGLYTEKGKELIPVLYDSIAIFSLAAKHTGLYKIILNGRQGIIDAVGRTIVPPLYEDIAEKGNLLMVWAGKKAGLYTVLGKQVCDTVYQDFKLSTTKYSRVLFSFKDSLKGIIKDDGTILYEPVFTATGYTTDTEGLLNPFSFNKGKYLYVQNSNHKLGILDEAKASMVIPVQYDGIYQKMETGTNTYFAVKKDNSFGIINNNDSIVIPFIYDTIDMSLANPDTYDEPQFVVKKGNLYGTVSLSGKELIPVIYQQLAKISNDNLYKAKTKNHYVLVDSKNKILNDGPFDDISVFDGNLTLGFYNNKMKLLSKSGAFVSEETPMLPPAGYATFEDLKQALIKAFNDSENIELRNFALKAAPSQHTLYFIKGNIFTREPLGFISIDAIREKYFNDLLQFKKTRWQTGIYNKSKLIAVNDFSFSDEGLITNTRTEEHTFGDTFLERFLGNAIRVNGYWISTYFMKSNFYIW